MPAETQQNELYGLAAMILASISLLSNDALLPWVALLLAVQSAISNTTTDHTHRMALVVSLFAITRLFVQKPI